MEHILRDIKLSKLTGIPPIGDADKLVKFWNELWRHMEVNIHPSIGKIECWKEGYEYYYFIQDSENDKLWCNYSKVWHFFDISLGLNYIETQELIQYMVDETLNCKVNIPEIPVFSRYRKVDETLNYKVNTPLLGLVTPDTLVDETLNCKVNTPRQVQCNDLIRVDETLNCKVNTPMYDMVKLASKH